MSVLIPVCVCVCRYHLRYAVSPNFLLRFLSSKLQTSDSPASLNNLEHLAAEIRAHSPLPSPAVPLPRSPMQAPAQPTFAAAPPAYAASVPFASPGYDQHYPSPTRSAQPSLPRGSPYPRP